MSTTKKECSVPEKYLKRSGITDSEYEINNTSLLALKCCFEELEEFWIAVNADGFGELGDVIMYKKRKQSDRGVAYLMQLKHQNAAKPITTISFLQDKGDFSFKKYSECYSDMQYWIETATKNEMLAYLKQNSEMLFIIFTNKSVSNKQQYTDRPATVVDLLIKIQKPSPILVDIGCDGDIFKINYEVLAAQPKINVEFLKRLYLFTNQSHNNDMEEKIKNILKDHLENKLQLSREDVSNIVSKFGRFIEHWAKGRLGGYYPLTKEKILRKFVELLLFPNMLIIHAEDNNEKDEEEDIWFDIIKDMDVTVIDDADDVVQRYVRNVTNNILCNSDIVNSITNINRTLMRVGNNSKNFLISDKYELLWKSNKIPLILKVSDERSALYIQKVFNQFPKIFKLIILNKTKINFEIFGDLQLFLNLYDLSIEHQQYISSKPIKLQGREGACIHKLKINLKLFKVKDILQILCGTFNVGRKFDAVPQFFVEMSLTTHIFDIKLLQHSKDIFVVRCGITLLGDFESVLINQLGIDAKKIIHWERLDQVGFNGQIIIFNDIESLQEIEAFSLKFTKPVHFLVWHGGDYADLIKSNNINENLKKHKKISKESISAKKLLEQFCNHNQPLVISAIPGMGKSVLMHYFALNMPIHLWVLDIPLAKYQDHYKNWEGQNSDSQQLNFERFLEEVVKAQQTPNYEIFNCAFEQFLNFKNVVFLLDGLDEVPVNRQNGAMQLIKFINESGYYMCVTTRPVLQEQLESTLNTFAITLNIFTENEQISFLTNYFANVGKGMPSNDKVKVFVYELLKATKSNLNDFDHQFTGVPLQTTLLAEVFKNDFLKYLDEGIFQNGYFDLIYLYKHFINKKIEIACAKVENVSEHMIDQYRQCRSFYALRHLFDEQDLEELKINEKINVINYMMQGALQSIQKDGITVIDGDSNVTFVHQTYAEYLAANWLAKNIKEHKEVVRKLVIKCFDSNFVVVRNMFDRILAKNCLLHTAIINRQLDKVNTLILDNNAFNITDRGGRTILHLLSAWRTPDQYNSWSTSNSRKGIKNVLNKIPKNKLRFVKDELLQYTPLDYAILSRSLKIADDLALAIPNPSCNVNLSKEETDYMLLHVKENYSVSLYIIILKCFIRTVSTEHETYDLYKSIRNEGLDKVTSQISELNVDALFDERCTCLHVATKGGHKDTIQFLLTNKADVKKRDDNGRSALHWASYLGHLEIMSMLLCKGAQLIATDCYNLTPYHYAVLSSLDDPTIKTVIETLLTASKSKLNATGKIAKIKHPYVHPLHLAAYFGQEEVLHLILSNIDDPNIKGWKGMTALMLAAQNNQINSLKILLANNADIDAKDHSNQTALDYAASEGCKEIVTILLDKNANINERSLDAESPLHLAAISGYQDIITILLTRGADINAQDDTDQTALHYAAKEGQEKVVTILLNNNADINARNFDNETPLHLAASGGYQDIVTNLLTNRADVQAQDDRYRTALHYAAEKGHAKIVTILLKYSPNMNAIDYMDQTVLHSAVLNGHKDIVTVLLTKNADMQARNSDNETPLDIAVRRRYQDIINILTNAQLDNIN